MKKYIIAILVWVVFCFLYANRSEALSEPVREVEAKAIDIPKTVEKEPESADIKPPEQPVIDPQGCEPEQYWAKEYPHDCIDKPKPAAKQPVSSPAPVTDWVTRCYQWAKQAGVPLNDAAIKLLDRESDCNPTARNPYSSAAGIPQALPWTKMGCDLSHEDAPCQIAWFYRYVMARYGSYEAALNHSYAHNWY